MMPKFSHWPCGSHPIYINPTFDELKELAMNRPDTIRIMMYEKDLALASGYGNTHDSVQKGYRQYCKDKSMGDDFILYCESRSHWFFNMMGNYSLSERLLPAKAIRLMPHSQETLAELVKLLTEPEPEEC